MNPIGIKQALRLKIDKWLHIDRKGEYGMMGIYCLFVYLWKRIQVFLVGQ